MQTFSIVFTPHLRYNESNGGIIMKKFFNLAALCLAPLFLAAIFSCSNNGDAPANLTQIIGTQQTDGQAAQTKFLTDWETMEFLYINDSGTLNKKIEAPNKYTGVLRFFYYFNKEVSQSATDFAFEVILGTDGAKNPAYYAALKYGIPMDADVKTNVNLLGAGNTSKTFHLLITPYSGIGRNEMSQGWYAFDIDMSAYTGKSFFTDGSPIQIACRANNKTSVSLGTDILGKIGGDFNGTIDKAKLQAVPASGKRYPQPPTHWIRGGLPRWWQALARYSIGLPAALTSPRYAKRTAQNQIRSRRTK